MLRYLLGKSAGSIAIAGTLLACASGEGPLEKSATPTPQTLTGGTLWVTGYYAGWYWEDYPPAAVDMSSMTHFVFGRYAPGGGSLGGRPGEVVLGAGTGHAPEVEDTLIARAHAQRIKALMMLGGGGDGDGFVASTSTGTRAAFIDNLLARLLQKDYDGVDIDWEEGLDDSPTTQRQLIALLTELRAAAARRPRYQAPHAALVITYPGSAININTDLPVEGWKVTVASAVDQYNLMTYGRNFDAPGWDSWFFSALKGAGPSHPTSVESSVQAYVDAGVPRGKLGMGIGLYGNYYAPPISGPRQQLGDLGGGDDNDDNYANFYAKGLFSHPSGAYIWDDNAQAGYYRFSPAVSYQKASWATVERIEMLTLEEPRGIAAKGAWARAGGCGGTIVWTINYGYLGPNAGNPPLDAIKQAFLGQ